MTIPSHLVKAKIAELRARGALQPPSTDEARCLVELDRLLLALASANGQRALRLRTSLADQQRALASVYDRTGQGMLAQVLRKEPVYDRPS